MIYSVGNVHNNGGGGEIDQSGFGKRQMIISVSVIRSESNDGHCDKNKLNSTVSEMLNFIFSFENVELSINFALNNYNMKRTLSLLSLVCLTILGQSQVVPNGNFETWAAGEPANWTTFNSIAPLAGITAPATQETPAPEGNSCINLSVRSSVLFGVVPGFAVSGQMDLLTGVGNDGFPFVTRPNFFEGVYRHNEMVISDTALASITLSKWNSTTMSRDVIAAGGMISIGGTDDWVSFSMPLEYYSDLNPDSCSIYLYAMGADGNNCSYDNLRLAMTSSIDDQSAQNFNWMVYPNPTNENLTLSLAALGFLGETQLEIFSADGKLVHSEKLINAMNPTLNIAHLTNGQYELALRNGNRRLVKTFVKN